MEDINVDTHDAFVLRYTMERQMITKKAYIDIIQVEFHQTFIPQFVFPSVR